ncbi:MAG: prephenate dehydrogenase [bacterium]
MNNTEKPYFKHIAIIGIGLLGGSIARTAKKYELVGSVTGCGRNKARLEYALANGIADRVTTDPEEAVRGADLVIVCTPVGLIPDILKRIAGSLEPKTIVTDVGSTKAQIVRAGESAMPEGVSFVGCHPMAGSEESGVEASTDTLFENALCVLTSSDKTNIIALEKLERFWKTLRARVMIMPPDEHDLLVAVASHLPHMVAVALVRSVADITGRHEKALPLLAGGFRDTTRIASGSADMWRDICLENREYIAKVIGQFGTSLNEISEAVLRGDSASLTEIFDSARRFREELPAKGRGILEPENEIFVDVADRPGVIGEITGALGLASINIRNINVQHVRELRGGALSIILEKADDIERAVVTLTERGFTVRKR